MPEIHNHACTQGLVMTPNGPMLSYACECGWGIQAPQGQTTVPGPMLAELAFAAHKIEWLEAAFIDLRADLLGLPRPEGDSDEETTE